MYYSGLYRANMNSWTDTAARSIILFLTLFMCFVATRSQTAVPRTAHRLNEPQGKFIFKITQNMYIRKTLHNYLLIRLSIFKNNF